MRSPETFESSDCLQAVLGVFNPHRLHMRLAGSLNDYFSGSSTAGAASTWVHEHMHFFQTIFTGFGQISWDAHRQMTSFLMTEWRGLDRVCGKQRLPLGYAALATERNQGISAVAYMTALEFIRLGSCRFWLSRPESTLEEAGTFIVKRPWRANPTITLGSQSHVLQGKEILEGHAAFVESTFLEQVGFSRKDAWHREARPQQYLVALDWFLQECGDERYHEYPFLCDLSLQTSWNPTIPSTEDDWRRSSPSWRFVRLVEALKDRPGLRLSVEEDLASNYSSFAGCLLTACNFAPLELVLLERLESFARKPELLHVEELMRRALLFRAERPWVGGNPALTIESLKELVHMFPAPIIEVEGQLGSSRPEEQSANFQHIAELQFQAFASSVLGDASGLAFRENAIECAFSKYSIHQGCEFQRDHHCSGRYRPADGTPFPVRRVKGSNVLTGCSFEMLINTMGMSSADLDVNFQAPPPIL